MNKGLWANIHAKRKRGERMRKKGEKGAPTPQAIAKAQGEQVDHKQEDLQGYLKTFAPKKKKPSTVQDYEALKKALKDKKKKNEDTTTADAGIPQDTKNMGPRHTSRIHDRRKKKGSPMLLKRFRDYYQEKGIM